MMTTRLTTRHASALGRSAVLLMLSAALAGCSSLGSSGPRTNAVATAAGKPVGDARIVVVNVDDAAARRLLAGIKRSSFSQELGDTPAVGTVIGRGDVLAVSIWEAPPAVLFGSSLADSRPSASGGIASMQPSTARSINLPEQMVDSSGRISVPFAGSIDAAGRTPRQIERDITARLSRIAHSPQVMVQLARNATANVTVVGDVSGSTRVQLTPRGERLLDVLAAAGGVKQSVAKTTIQITRGSRLVSLPLDAVIRDPSQNIRLQPDDVVTALYQPWSFTALGAIGNNAEVNFEASGLTLAQALGRIGGLRDERANVHGVFVFRLEDPRNLDPAQVSPDRMTPDGRVPVIYRIDFADPASFFVSQSFPIRDKDVLYVSNAPLVDFQKFMNMISSVAITGLSIGTTIP